jgi:hypothetical protein
MQTHAKKCGKGLTPRRTPILVKITFAGEYGQGTDVRGLIQGRNEGLTRPMPSPSVVDNAKNT